MVIELEKMSVKLASDTEVPEKLELRGLKIKENHPVNSKKIGIYKSPNCGQDQGMITVFGIYNSLREASMEPLHSGFIEALLRNEKSIPVAWRKYIIFFWGTFYEGNYHALYVPCLYWDKSKKAWQVSQETLYAAFTEQCVSACSLPSS